MSLPVLLVVSYGLVSAFWMYSEALLSSRINVGLLGGLSVGFLGWIGVLVASLAKIPLMGLLSFPHARRMALIASSIVLLVASLQRLLLPLGGLDPAVSYILASMAYGLASAAIFTSILNDVDYVEWPRALTSANIIAYGIAVIVLVAWSLTSVDLSSTMALTSAILLLAVTPAIGASILPSMTLKTVEVIADILSFRRSPETYKLWYVDVVKLALILGGLGALKISILSIAIHNHGVLSLVALATGALLASITASHTAKPRIAMILALITSTTTLITDNQLVKLTLVGLAITYSYLTIMITVLDKRPKAIYKAITILTIAVALGSLTVGALSLANPATASKITTLTTILLVIITLTLTLKEGRRWT